MSSFDTNRIVGLDAKFAETIQCPICLMILNEPLMTKCGHSFCHQCLKDTVKSDAKDCPKCRKPFTKKRPKESLDDSCVAIAYNTQRYVFSKNLGFNGCKESVELDSMPKHINECEHKSCKSCGFRLKGSTDDHIFNCNKQLRNERNESIKKYEKSLEENKKLREEVNELRNDMNDWKLKYEMKVEENRIISEQKLMLTNERNQLNDKYEKSLEENKKLKEDINGLRNEKNEWKDKYQKSSEENQRISEELNALNNRSNEWKENKILLISNENNDLKLKFKQIKETNEENVNKIKELSKILKANDISLPEEKSETKVIETNGIQIQERFGGQLTKLRLEYKDIAKCITDGKVDNYLIDIINGTERYNGRFKAFKVNERYRYNSPYEYQRISKEFNEDYQREYVLSDLYECLLRPTYDHCYALRLSSTLIANYMKDPSKIKSLIFGVLIPEAIIKAIMIVTDCSRCTGLNRFNRILNL